MCFSDTSDFMGGTCRRCHPFETVLNQTEAMALDQDHHQCSRLSFFSPLSPGIHKVDLESQLLDADHDGEASEGTLGCGWDCGGGGNWSWSGSGSWCSDDDGSLRL